MMEHVLVDLPQQTVELLEVKKVKRSISKIFYFISILLVGFLFLRILDIISTVICLGSGIGFESNPMAIEIVEKPDLWFTINLIIFGVLFGGNFGLWFFNKKNDMMVNYISLAYGGMILIVLMICVWPVINNFAIIFEYIGQV